MNSLQEILAKLQGRDLEAEEDQKKKAGAAIAEHEQATGEKYEEEPGIEPDYTLEEGAMLAAGAPAAATTGGLRAVAKYAGKKALQKGEQALGNTALDKLKEKGPPANPPHWSEVAKGEGEAPSFAKFIRGEAKKEEGSAANMAPAGAAKPEKESLQVPRFGTNEKVKALQNERQSLNLNTPEGRARLKEIDSMLSNRSYFKEE